MCDARKRKSGRSKEEVAGPEKNGERRRNSGLKRKEKQCDKRQWKTVYVRSIVVIASCMVCTYVNRHNPPIEEGEGCI